MGVVRELLTSHLTSPTRFREEGARQRGEAAQAPTPAIADSLSAAAMPYHPLPALINPTGS